MCVNIEVTLPVVESCLFKFDLRPASFIILLYTTLRESCFLYLFHVALLEVLVHQPGMHGSILLKSPPPVMRPFLVYYVYLNYMAMLYSSAFILVFCIFLWYGIAYDKPNHFEYYLLCRFVTWMLQTLSLTLLAARHELFFPLYLFMLLLIVIDVYPFIVVYSQYVNVLIEHEKKMMEHYKKIPCRPC